LAFNSTLTLVHQRSQLQKFSYPLDYHPHLHLIFTLWISDHHTLLHPLTANRLESGHQVPEEPEVTNLETILSFIQKHEESEMSNRNPRPNNQPSGRGRGPAAILDTFGLPGVSRGTSLTSPVPTGPSMQYPPSQRDVQSPINALNDRLRRTYLNDGSQGQNTMPRNQGDPQQHSSGGNRLQRQQSTMPNRNLGGNPDGHNRDVSSSTQFSGSSQGKVARSSASTAPGGFNPSVKVSTQMSISFGNSDFLVEHDPRAIRPILSRKDRRDRVDDCQPTRHATTIP